jgi:2-amino-4-hydroxy-6-hydroxymethyldihydropteridine diphosphokinase
MPVRRSIYILLGSNLKKPLKQLDKAKKYIEQSIGKIIRISGIYRTAPWGNPNQPVFYNQVIKLYSSMNGLHILHAIKKIEYNMGRIRTVKWGPRIIDIDILFIGYQEIKLKQLEVPHPRIKERMFVLAPLDELIPGFKHPAFGQSIHQLMKMCSDHLFVKKID